MSWLSFFQKQKREQPSSSASAAKDRLQVIISHERVGRGREDFLPKLQQELVQVVARYVAIDPSKVQVNLERGGDVSALSIDIELPGPKATAH